MDPDRWLYEFVSAVTTIERYTSQKERIEGKKEKDENLRR